jgi:hypothetical protein
MTSKEKLKVLTELCDDCFETLRNSAHRRMNEQMLIDHGGGAKPERWTTDVDAFWRAADTVIDGVRCLKPCRTDIFKLRFLLGLAGLLAHSVSRVIAMQETSSRLRLGQFVG